ncbi:MAG: peptidoglycan DD-metalloendopeptidase family protein [Candidatus Peribacteraceae bacterium]|nr:peptidoglycan DD-metalloendopeptidase family protein [Candidatus Peribacteraceae bacterium]
MHTIRRFAAGCLFLSAVLCAGSIPFLHASVISTERVAVERQERMDALRDAMGTSAHTISAVPGVQALREEGEAQLAEAQKALQEYGQRKHAVRLRIAAALQSRDAFQSRYGVDPLDSDALAAFFDTQRSGLAVHLRAYGRLHFAAGSVSADPEVPAFLQLMDQSLAEQVQERLRQRALATMRLRILTSAQEVVDIAGTLENLRAEHASLIASYQESLTAYDDAQDMIALSNARLAEIKRIVAAVEQQVRAMQADLSAYDERIRLRAEGELIARGLLSERRSPSTAVPRFDWPVTGNITAGFLDPGYAVHFGVPHKAIDIAQSQGSIIRAAADGVVHYVQNGGSRGYSYVLIGHRGGYATLYGHLLQISVTPGDDIDKGQIVGLSGGVPGTPGSGPMTTGAHLHFEVIRDGVNINPIEVLP